jgi:iron complex outermembrane receptor protein
MLSAQNAGTITGTISDQAGKPIAGAAVTVKSAGTAAAVTAASDEQGRFSVTNLAAGNYTVEVTSPGFARNTRLDVPVSAAKPQDLPITLNVDSISQSITVHETVLLAADTAPQGNTLDAASAQTIISNAVITNFMAPVADFAEVIQQAPGAFSLNPNGIGLGQGKIVLSRLR